MEEGLQGFDNVDEDAEDMRALLQYMYTGSLPADADHKLLLGLMRLSDYYKVAGLMESCEAMLMPLVSKENVVDVLNSVKSVQHVHLCYKQVYDAVKKMVQESDELLDEVFSSVRPEGPSIAEVSDDYGNTEPQKLTAVPHSIDSQLSLSLLPQLESSVQHGGKQQLDTASCKDNTSQSEAGPSHAQSGSSDKGELPAPEAKHAGSQTSQDAAASIKGAGHTSGACDVGSVTAAADSEPPAGNSGAAAEAAPRTITANSADEPSPPPPPPGLGLSSSSASHRRPDGPRRKTRRGKGTQKEQCLQRHDQMSIPDTHDSWE